MSNTTHPQSGTGSSERTAKTAVLYRMATPDHICPFGLKSKALLQREGYQVDDNLLTSRTAQDAFKAEHGVETTPQTFIDGARVGGYDALLNHFDKEQPDEGEKTYAPIIAIFGATFLMAIAAGILVSGGLAPILTIELFVAFSMCVLAIQKLRDLESFTNQFLGYDILAQRVVRYAYVYPFAELGAGVLMIAHALTWIAAPVALVIGGIGGISVYKAVYVDKRDLKCACVGGDSNVPLGAISLSENVGMVLMALWMLIK